MYKTLIKPILFKLDPEFVHDITTLTGYILGSNQVTTLMLDGFLGYENQALEQTYNGLLFKNPFGLAAGFDYTGRLSKVLSYVGFGYNTVGTVTHRYYEGNTKPRLGRLPKSQALFVNKGFKSEGALKIAQRLDDMQVTHDMVGISVGASNLSDVNTLQLAIDDCVQTFNIFKNKEYVKYFEMNISCPNLKESAMFTNPASFSLLLQQLKQLSISKPIYVKMPNELDVDSTYSLVKLGIDNGISGFIFSNLVKDRSNGSLDKNEVAKFDGLKGNFSGLPTRANSDKLIAHIYKKAKGETLIIGCGGIFCAQDAYRKIKLGANLVQLVTGLVYEGPFLIKNMKKELVTLLKNDGFDNISQAIGSFKY